MGAVRKLALVVVIGLIAVSTAIMVYTAAEPNRRADETSEQESVSIERGTQLYITYCLRCHGPAGLGSLETDANGESMGRVGAPLNQSTMTEEQIAGRNATFQSDDPVSQTIAQDYVRFRIMYGVPSEAQLYQTYNQTPSMPAFRHDLNVEEINSLVYLITHGDWNYVYNTVVHDIGKQVYEATPEADRAESCDEYTAYPTVAPTAAPEGEGGDEGAATPDANTGGDESGSGTDHAVTSTDNAFDTNAITVKPGDTITLTNEGFVQHDLAITDLGLETELLNNGQSATLTIPADAAPGEYEFHCTVAGHKESGMTGTITVEAP